MGRAQKSKPISARIDYHGRTDYNLGQNE